MHSAAPTPAPPDTTGDPRRWVTGAALAGLLVGLCDLAALGRWLAQDLGDWFELPLWAAAWVTASPVLLACAAGATLGLAGWATCRFAAALERRSSRLQRREGLALALLLAPLLLPLALYLALRPSLLRHAGSGPALVLAAVLAAALLWLTWRALRALPGWGRWLRSSRGRRLGGAALLALAGVGLFWLDASAYRRLYAPLHWVLALAAFASFGGAVSLLRAPRPPATGQVPTGGRVALLAGPLALLLLLVASEIVARNALTVRPMVHAFTVVQDKLLRLGGLPLGELLTRSPRPVRSNRLTSGGDATGRSARLRARLGLAPAGRPPNIFLFSLDAVRAGSLDLAGAPGGKTLSRLAAKSTVFEQAYTPGPDTLTTMGSWITGPSPAQPGQPTLYEALASQGYQTACLVPWRYLGPLVGRQRPGCDVASPAPSLKLLRATLDDVTRRFSNQRPIFAHVHVMEAHDVFEPRAYAAALRRMDAALGRWLATLRQHKLLEDAVVIVTADHGQALGERGVRGHASQLYNEQIHVPLLLWSSAGRRARVKQPASAGWLGATIRALAGAPHAGPLLFDEQPVYSTYRSLSAVVVGRHKLIYDGERRSLELFDLRSDPKERRNLVDRDPATRRRLVQVLERARGKALDL